MKRKVRHMWKGRYSEQGATLYSKGDDNKKKRGKDQRSQAFEMRGCGTKTSSRGFERGIPTVQASNCKEKHKRN